MFNTLNRFIARLDGGPPPSSKEAALHRGYGFQVLRNTNAELPIDPWFDFVVSINGRTIDDPDPRLFAQEVRNCAGGMVVLGLWSAKGQRPRTMHIPVPVPATTPTLGLTLKWTPLARVANVWHVLDVQDHSPADAAGLLAHSDYILGSPEVVLHGESGLAELVEDYLDRSLRLWVYNHEYDVTRELTITPSRDWGGEGALGCVLGFGALHRLPAPLSEPVSAPGETMFDGAEGARGGGSGEMMGLYAGQSQAAPGLDIAGAPAGGPTPDYLVPADIVGTPPPPLGSAHSAAGGGGMPPPRAKKKDRHGGGGHSAGRGMDDYFQEQEKMSRELDNAPSGQCIPAAPPPKAGGGPPRGGPPRTGPPLAVAEAASSKGAAASTPTAGDL